MADVSGGRDAADRSADPATPRAEEVAPVDKDTPTSPRDLSVPSAWSGDPDSGTTTAGKRKSPNRVHFTPDLPGEDSPTVLSPQKQQDGILEEPIPPRRPASAGTSFTPNSFTPASPSPAPIRHTTQQYNAPSHNVGVADLPRTAETELLEQAMSGYTWEQPANLRLQVLFDFEPCCSVELRAYQGQYVTGLFQNGAWVYVRASNGAEGYLPTVSCGLTKDRAPSIDISSSGVSSVGTADDDGGSNSGSRYGNSSSLERGVSAHNSTTSGLNMTSPDGRTSGYSSEPEKTATRVKFAPTASILQPGYRNVHMPQDYVTMYHKPRSVSASSSNSTWQPRAGSQRYPSARSQSNQYAPGPVVTGAGASHASANVLNRARNMSYPMDRLYPGNSPLAHATSNARAEEHQRAMLSKKHMTAAEMAAAASALQSQAPTNPTASATASITSTASPAVSSSSRSRRLIDRLKNFRSSSTAAPGNVEMFDVDGSATSHGQISASATSSGSKDSRKDGKKKKQQKKNSMAKKPEYVTSDTELSTSRFSSPLSTCRTAAAAMTDSELTHRQLQRLDLAGMPAHRTRPAAFNAAAGQKSRGAAAAA
eukprot:scpid63008/ scgid5787/ 